MQESERKCETAQVVFQKTNKISLTVITIHETCTTLHKVFGEPKIKQTQRK